MQVHLLFCWCSWEVDRSSSWFYLKHNYEQFVYDISQSCHILEKQRLTTVRMIGRKRESPEDVRFACNWEAHSTNLQNMVVSQENFRAKWKDLAQFQRKETQDIFATKFISFHVWNMLFITVRIVWNVKKTGLSHPIYSNETTCTC